MPKELVGYFKGDAEAIAEAIIQAYKKALSEIEQKNEEPQKKKIKQIQKKK